MAIIGKIRSRSGLLLVIIGVALAAFVLGDLVQNLGKGNNFDQTKLALVNDEKISSQDFSSRVSEQTEMLKQQLKKDNLTNEESFQTVIDVWNVVKRETLLGQQMEELGLIQKSTATNSSIADITMDEYMNRITGTNIHPEILRNFSDPKTGQFNPQAVSNFLNYLEENINNEDAEKREQAIESQKQWNLLVKYIKNDIKVSKYNSLISKAYYLPKALAEVEFVDNNKMEKTAFFAAQYKLVTDEESVPTDADFNAYYEEHKQEFKNKEELRKIEYIVWNISPSQKDIQELESQIQQLSTELKNANKQSVASIINQVGDNRYDSSWVKAGTLSPYIDSAAFVAEIGTVIGPWTENTAYHIARVMDRQVRPDSMKASHILISYGGAYGADPAVKRTKIAARALADSIQAVLSKKGDNFEQLVNLSDDPSKAQNKGSLDWFADGGMIPEFNQACVENEKGVIKVVETAYGFHVLRVDDKKNFNTRIRIAQLNLPITFSSETFNAVYGEAIKFAASNQTYDAFDTASASLGLNVIKSDFINSLSKGITGLKDSREMVKWMFNETTEKGSMSNVFDFENQIALAVLTEINPKGILPLESVKEGIKSLVQREVKAKILIEKMKSVSDLTMATQFQSKIDTANLAFATYSLPTYGPEPVVQGKIAVAEKGKLMGPIKGEQGIFFFKVLENGEIPKKMNLDYLQQRSAESFTQRVGTSAYNAIEENAEIEEFINFFY